MGLFEPGNLELSLSLKKRQLHSVLFVQQVMIIKVLDFNLVTSKAGFKNGAERCKRRSVLQASHLMYFCPQNLFNAAFIFERRKRGT